MLYKLGKTHDKFDSLEPLKFSGISHEKELEDLLAKHLWDVLFEGNELMPISQERARQPEADIYALDKIGDLHIFELKRDDAGESAVHQALRYCENAAHWPYERLEKKLSQYLKREVVLQDEHKSSFNLERPLDKSAFNVRQHLIVIGSAGDEELIRNVDYWKSRGLSINFIPYRIYKIGSEDYFEFFSLPYDRHSNPAKAKGVIFDTNSSWDKDAIWYMCEKDRVAAFGDQKDVVRYLHKNDIVFFYHKNRGIVAAGKIIGAKVETDTANEALYLKVEWLTSIPKRGTEPKAMTAAKIKEVLEHDFYWARTIKAPYLSSDESKKLLDELRNILG
jgi:hypothetical protein